MLKHIHEKLLLILIFLLPCQTAYLYREVFVNGYKFHYATGALYLTELILLVTLIFFVADALVNIKRLKSNISFSFSKDRLFVMSLLIVLLYGFVSMLWAGDRHVAFEHAVVLLEGAVMGLLVLVSRMKTSTLVKTFLAGTALSALLGIVQVILQQTWSSTLLGTTHYDISAGGTSIVVAGMRWLRAYGTFPHPNIFGGWMAVSLVLSLYLLFGKKIKDVYAYGLLTLFFTALVVSFSRSAWIAGFVSTVFILVSQITCGKSKMKNEKSEIKNERSEMKNQKSEIKNVISWRTGLLGMTVIKVVLCFVILSIFFVTLFHSLLTSRISIDNTYETRSVNERKAGYEIARDMIANNMVFGTGVGNYTLAVYEKLQEYPHWDFQPVHNVFVLILAEWGIVGLLLCGVSGVLFMLWLLSVTLSVSPYKVENSLRTFAISLLSMYIMIAVFDHYLYSLYPGVMLSGLIFGFVARFMLLPTE